MISEKGGAERREIYEVTELSVGRVQGNDLMLPKGNVSKRHARLLYRDGRFIVTDLNSTNGTYVNRRRIAQATIVREGDRIYIGDYVLRIESGEGVEPQPARRPVTGSMPGQSQPAPEEPSSPALMPSEEPSAVLPSTALGQSAYQSDERSEARRRAPSIDSDAFEVTLRQSTAPAERIAAWLSEVFRKVADEAGKALLEQRSDHSPVIALLDSKLAQSQPPFDLPSQGLDRLKEQLRSELLALGPLGPLLDDPQVTHISVPRFDQVVVIREGRRSRASAGFSCDAALRLAIARLCQRAGGEPGPNEYAVERRLPHGALLGALLDPAMPAFCVISRAFEASVTMEELVRRGVVSRAMATLLAHAVIGRANILVFGGQDGGSELVVNALASAAEDSALLSVEHVDPLLATSARVRRVSLRKEGLALSRLIHLAHRLQESRMIIDVGPADAGLLALEAITDGADGVIAVGRAPSAATGLTRLAAAISAVRHGIAPEAAREWLARSFDLVVTVRQLRDGRHRVLKIAEPSYDAGQLAARDIFAFVIERTAAGGAIEGSFSASGIVPQIVEDLGTRGLPLDSSLFSRPPSR